MNISAWSIKNPVPAVLLFILLTIVGLFSFHKMGIQNFPDIDFPMITVTATLEGASPSQLENDVARKLEDQISSIDKVKHINTTISRGSVSIAVEFEFEKDGEEALSQIRNAIDIVSPELPANMQPPVIAKVTTSGDPFVTYMVRADNMDLQQLSWFVDNTLNKAIRQVKGVGAVTRLGGVEREIQVILNSSKLAALELTAETVTNQLLNMQQDISAGESRIASKNQTIRVLAATHNANELSQIFLPTGSGRFVKLSEIADVIDTYAERDEIAQFNGDEVIAIQVTRSKGSSEVDVSKRVEEAIALLRIQYPEITLEQAYDTTSPVVENYQGSMNMLYEGAFLAVLVVFLFLKDWRATLVSAAALPLSVIPTFAVMYLLGFSINQLTLLSLALVIGILVDDAIVEVENIMRHLQMGKTPLQAAMEAANEIGLAVVATTFTLVAVFLPTGFMSGISGKFFEQFGMTAAIAVLFSLLVARMLTPMLAAYLMKANTHEHKSSRLMHLYTQTASWCQHHRKSTIAGALCFLAASVAILPLLPTGFVPPADIAQTKVMIELPPGSQLADSEDLVAAATARILTLPEVNDVFAVVGKALTSGAGPGQASSSGSARLSTLVVSLSHRTDRHESQVFIEKQIRDLLASLPGARFNVGGTNSGESLQITLVSESSIALKQAALDVEKDLRKLPGLGSISSGISVQQPEIQIVPHYVKAARLGVSSTQLANIIRLATYGDYEQSLPKLNLPERQIPVRVRQENNSREHLESLRRIQVPTNSGMTMLGNLADIYLGAGDSEIKRLDRMRQITVKVELGGQSIGDVMAAVSALPSLKQLPGNVRQVDAGEAENMSELFTSFGTAMLLGLLCIYIVRVLLFHDFMQPATILAAIPLSAGGAFFALLVTNNSLSLPSVIGVIMLMGVVTKNSILLVEYAVIARREFGFSRYKALMDACQKRARPIVMTTIAMGMGMLPTAIGIGADPSFRGPMAIVVIGGLITSTFLSLLVIPVVFTYVDDLVIWLSKVFQKETEPQH